MLTLHIHGNNTHNLDDFYTSIESQIQDTTPLYSRNLDALSDVLSEMGLEKVVLHDNKALKENLDTHTSDASHEMSMYYKILDVFLDLPGVDIELEG